MYMLPLFLVVAFMAIYATVENIHGYVGILLETAPDSTINPVSLTIYRLVESIKK